MKFGLTFLFIGLVISSISGSVIGTRDCKVLTETECLLRLSDCKYVTETVRGGRTLSFCRMKNPQQHNNEYNN